MNWNFWNRLEIYSIYNTAKTLLPKEVYLKIDALHC